MQTLILPLRNIARQRTRSLLSAFAVALGVAAIVASGQVAAGIQQSMHSQGGVFDVFSWIPDLMTVFLNAAGVIILLAASVLVYNAFGMSVVQRRQEVGALRALGMTRAQVVQMFVLESALTGLLGAGLGLLAGPGLGRLMLWIVSGPNSETGDLSPWTFLAAAALGLLTAVLAAWGPAKRAARLSPLEAIRDENVGTSSPLPLSKIAQAAQKLPNAILERGRGEDLSRQSGNQIARFVGTGLLLLALWVYLAIAPPGSWLRSPYETMAAGAAVMAWLVGLVILLPWLALLPFRALKRAKGVILRLATSSAARNPQRLAMDVLNFAVGVAAITMLNGILFFQDKVLLVELNRPITERTRFTIQSFDMAQALQNFDSLTNGLPTLNPAILKRVDELTQGRASVAEESWVNIPEIAMIPGTNSFMTGLDRIIDDGFAFIEGDRATAEAWIKEGCAVLVPTLVSSRVGLHPGDWVSLHGPLADIQCRVAGVGTGGLGPFSFVSLHAKAAYEVTSPTSLHVTPRAGVDAGQLKADLLALQERYPGQMFVQDGKETIDSVLKNADTLLSSVNAMLLLAVITAGLAVFNTTLISVSERRREMGLLRSIGATRGQALAMLAAEAGLSGFTGGLLGMVAGVGATMIFALVQGGSLLGLPDLPLWPAAIRSGGAASLTGLLGLLGVTLLSPVAAWLAARPTLQGTPVQILAPSSAARAGGVSAFLQRSSLRARLMVGATALLAVLLAALMLFTLQHARVRLEEQAASAVGLLANLNARMIESVIPPAAENLSLAGLMGALPSQAGPGGKSLFDAGRLLDMQTLINSTGDDPIKALTISDREGIVLISLDMREIGKPLPAASRPSKLETTVERHGTVYQVLASAPIRNASSALVGGVRVTMALDSLNDFLLSLGLVLGLIGAGTILVGLLLAWGISTPLQRMTGQLSSQAGKLRQGVYQPVELPSAWKSGLLGRLALSASLRVWITLLLVLLVALLVGMMELVTIPSQRREVERMLVGKLSSGAAWIGDGLSQVLGETAGQPGTPSLEALLAQSQNFDLSRLQGISDLTRSQDIAYLAITNLDGKVLFSDQDSLTGQKIAVSQGDAVQASAAQEGGDVLTGVWREKPVWIVSTPIQQGTDGARIGTMQMAVYRQGLDSFIAESRTVLRLFGLAALLGAILLAQWTGGAVTAPVRQLAAGAHAVAQGNLDTRFSTRGASSELVVLARAYNEMVAGLREREWLRDMFGRFVSPDVAEVLRSGQVKLEGENRVVTTLFCDIRGYTTRSEQLTPREIVSLLNEYRAVLVEAVQRQHGSVNQFSGDGAFIIFGAPKVMEDSARCAILAALDFRQGLVTLNERLEQRGDAPIRVGVGINTGPVVAGAIGPAERQEYTVIGDTVNLASRIEALNKEFPAYDILISDQTRAALGPHAADFEMVCLGDVPIRGKSEPVRIWAVAGRCG